MGQAPKCLSPPGASNDMQHDLLRSLRDLDLRSNFEVDLSRSNYIWFDSPRRDKHDGIHIIAVYLKQKSYSRKKISLKNNNFDFGDLWSLNR